MSRNKKIRRSPRKLANVQTRMDRVVKERAERVFRAVGLDAPTAIRMFYMKAATVGGIPFDVRINREAGPETSEFPWTQKEMEAACKESLDPRNVYGPFDTADELFDHLEKHNHKNA